MADWPGIYNTGTATVAANGTTVTLQNAGNIAQAVRPGDRFGSHIGRPIRIAAVAASSLTLAFPWPGPAQTAAPYEISFTPYDGGYRQAMQTFLDRYGSGGVAALAQLELVADRLVYADGAGSLGLSPLTAFARTLLDDANAGAALSTLGVSAFAKTLLDDADASAALTTLGVSTFIKTLLDDANQAAALTTLGAQPAGSYQASDAKLTSLSGLSGAADRLPYLSSANAFSLATLTSFARSILDDADAAAVWATLGGAQARSANGYQKLPGGLIIQWGFVAASAVPDGVVPLVTAYPNANFGVVASPVTAPASIGVGAVNVASITNSQFSVYRRESVNGGAVQPSTAVGVYWHSIGY